MTIEEKREIRIRMLVDMEAAEEDLGYLRSQAYRVSGVLSEAAQKIEHNASLEPSQQDFSAEDELTHRLSPEAQAHLNYGELLRIIEQLRVARQKVVNLRNRKQLTEPARQP